MIQQLHSKITRIKAGIVALTESSPDCIVRTFEKSDEATYEALSFAGTDDDILNDIHSLISNVASLKDHLKNWCRQNGVTFDTEAVISNCLPAAIVHDLWNIDKHLSLDRAPRSGFLPRIGSISQELLNPDGTKTDGIQILSNSYDGADFANFKGQRLIARVRASVYDDMNNEIGDILDICDAAIAAWAAAYHSAGAPVAP